MLTVVTDRVLRVNFGVFAGRNTTPAELDELAQALLPELGQVTIVAEDRRELNDTSETSLHQVRVELPPDADMERVVAVAERWASAQIEGRHAEVFDAPNAP